MAPESSVSSTARPGKVTAMISSTAFDLPQHRELAHKACIEAGVFPIGMEALPARDASGITASLEMVDKADIYLGIYANRYGWVPDGKDVSITEMEFDHAAARKASGDLKEIIVFTAHADHPFKAGDIETDATAQAKLRKFKDKATAGRVRKEFTSAQELHRLIFQALTEWKARQPVSSASNGKKRKCTTPRNKPAASGPADATNRLLIPNNLPRLPHFFGREKELATIADALDHKSRTWGALIDGPGGMGKTSLAIRAAEKVPAADFQRILFLSAKEREMTADGQRRLDGYILPGYQEMLNEMARQLQLPNWQTHPEPDRPQILLEVLSQKPGLLILDNLESLTEDHRNQLYTFLGRLPPGCKAIVTSRRRTDIDARIIRLEKLDRPAAQAYLGELFRDRPHLTPPTPEQCESLYTETGGNPLIMRWLVGQLGRGKCKTIAKALDFLRSAPDNNDPLEFIFGDLLDTFTPEETAALCALTYYTGPVEVKHISAIAGHSLTATATALEDLTDRSLVTADAAGEKYVLTPLVADFLRKKKPEMVAETGDRLEKRTYALIIENGWQHHARFPALEAAWPGIAPALALFLAGDNERLQTVCDALTNFLNFQGRWDERLALCEKAEARAVATADHDNAGWRAYQAGMIHYLRQQADAVLTCADRAAAHWATARAGARERAAAMGLRGLGHQLMKVYPAAIAAYRESLALHRSLAAESVDVASGLNDLARVEQLSGDLATAEEHYREALRVACAVGDAEGLALSPAIWLGWPSNAWTGWPPRPWRARPCPCPKPSTARN